MMKIMSPKKASIFLKEMMEDPTKSWDEVKPILDLCNVETEYTWNDNELAMTMAYENLGLKLPYGHPTSDQMIYERIQDLRRTAFNYLRMHVNEEGENPLDKAIEYTDRYNKAMRLWFLRRSKADI